MTGSTGPTITAATAAVLFIFLISLQPSSASQFRLTDLKDGFYSATCPRAEHIVRATVGFYFAQDPTISAGLLRLHFHDCFVRGCDASIMLDKDPSGEPSEKSSNTNGYTLRGLDVIDEIKHRLERECPSTVSCSDILALAARDASILVGLPPYPVPSGRHDGCMSRASDPSYNLPSPNLSVPYLRAYFAKKGFNQTEMVVLSGAHSIGGTHCFAITQRLYDYKPGTPQDPSLEPEFARMLKVSCPQSAKYGEMLMVPFDWVSPFTLDGSYYDGLLRGKGLLRSDQALMQNKETRGVVRRLAENHEWWAEEFGKAMVKVGALDVLVGEEGEIRRNCKWVN